MNDAHEQSRTIDQILNDFEQFSHYELVYLVIVFDRSAVSIPADTDRLKAAVEEELACGGKIIGHIFASENNKNGTRGYKVVQECENDSDVDTLLRKVMMVTFPMAWETGEYSWN